MKTAPTSITGMGMVSSLGLDVATSSAAARAGISRAKELDYFTLWSPTDGEVSSVKAHEVPLIAEAFEGAARLVRILGAAFADLCAREPPSPWNPQSAACYLALPDRFRVWRGAELVGDPEIRERFLAAQQDIPDDNTEFDEALRIYELAMKSADVSSAPKLQMVSRGGNCAMSQCIIQAMNDLANGSLETAVVAGVDSLLEEATLEWLAFTGRLKSPAVPTGLAPGEAAVVLCLQAGSKAEHALAQVSSGHHASEENSLLSGEPVRGHAVSELIKATDAQSQQPPWFITDHNGEDYRAMEWGHALLRMELDSAVVSRPAISFGDTGAASAGVAVAQVVHAFGRGCAPSNIGYVLSAAASSERTALVIER